MWTSHKAVLPISLDAPLPKTTFGQRWMEIASIVPLLITWHSHKSHFIHTSRPDGHIAALCILACCASHLADTHDGFDFWFLFRSSRCLTKYWPKDQSLIYCLQRIFEERKGNSKICPDIELTTSQRLGIVGGSPKLDLAVLRTRRI